MKIVFLLERPSQFDAPLFRLAAGDPRHEFEAWFLDPAPGAAFDDPEVGAAVSWGSDPTAGYPSRVVPAEGGAEFFNEAARGLGFLIVNGYTQKRYREAAGVAKRAGIPTALRIDSVRFPSESGPSFARRTFVRHLLPRRFDGFLTTGSLGRSFLESCGVPPRRIGLFPYAVDHAAFAAAAATSRPRARERWGLSGNGPVVSAVTKLADREAPWDLLAASGELAGIEGLRIVIAGDGPLRRPVEARAEGQTNVRLLGYVPYAELPSLYAAADLFVHPVQEERWGVSVAEALASGLPAVTSDRVGAGYDLVRPGNNGERYRSGDPSGLARAMRAALALDREAVRRVSRETLEPFGLEATWRRIVEIAERGWG